MVIGCVKEIKKHEYRVGLTPHCVRAYVDSGHTVLIEKDGGLGASFSNRDYIEAGGTIVSTAREIYKKAEMIVKVKEPLREEFDYLNSGQILYTYLHLAANRELTQHLISKGVTSIAYETMEGVNGELPCLKPMSEIAGRLSIQEGAKYLEKPFGGRGVLLGGVPGVRRGRVTILGGGVVGTNAAQMAIGMGAQVTVLDISPKRLEYLDNMFFGRVQTLYSTRTNILKSIEDCDLLIGAVLIPGARAPHLVFNDDLKLMKKGSVIVDVSVDQGGCIEATRPTTHDDPLFLVNGVINYCVANMPGAVSRTSTEALTVNTLGYGLKIAELGIKEAAKFCKEIEKGISTYCGYLTSKPVADQFDLPFKRFLDI